MKCGLVVIEGHFNSAILYIYCTSKINVRYSHSIHGCLQSRHSNVVAGDHVSISSLEESLSNNTSDTVQLYFQVIQAHNRKYISSHCFTCH